MYMTIPWQFELVEHTGSTNTDLMNRWHNHALSEPISLMALTQTAGRGRRGNTWISQANQSLTFSLAYPFSKEISMMRLQGLSLACGLSVLKSLINYFQLSDLDAKKSGLGLKWPNDILLGHRKLGGILVEGGQKTPLDPIWMVIGVGLNISIPPIESEHLASANILELCPTQFPHIDIQSLWKQLSRSMGDMLNIFKNEAFIPFQDDWNAWNTWRDLQVEVFNPSTKIVSGKCRGVNSVGYLMIDSFEGMKEISNGELSLSKVS
jgi:BirA family biotin operon repressor/biotin-[acetyl-CoA-carboxylase] ligase